jgi:Tfp pilus assembly protein PilV
MKTKRTKALGFVFHFPRLPPARFALRSKAGGSASPQANGGQVFSEGGQPPHQTAMRFARKTKKSPLWCWGQSTLEIVIAITILTIGLSAAVLVIFEGQSVSLDTQESNQAINLARQNLENSAVATDFSSIASGSSTQGEFTKEIIVVSTDANTKRVTSRVSWSTDPRRVQNVELTTLVTDWKNTAATGGDTGGGGTTGDWTIPQTLGSIDLGPGNSATDLDVVNKIVYLTAVASAESKSDFYIVNASDGQNPYIVSNVNTGPGLNSIDVAGNYAYVANNKTMSQLQVIDITNGALPYLLKSYTLPGVSGNGAIGNAIFYYNFRVYLGTKTATGPEFHVIDVSNPANPTELGSYEVSADVSDISVNGATAYLAIGGTYEVIALDVTNPGNIQLLGSYDIVSDNSDGQSVYTSGNNLYLGLTGSTKDFSIWDSSNPAALKLLGSADIGGTSVNGITVRDNLAFLATSASNKEFQVWDISSSTNPTLWSSFNFPQVASGIDYENNLVYVSVRSNDALRIITTSQ